jgi:hypothetical protein
MNGKTIISEETLKTGDEIETILHQGKVTSKIISTSNTKDHE